jgi:uncharacterized protein YggE
MTIKITDQQKFVFLAVILGGLFYLAGQYIASQPQRIAEESEAKREIAVQGRGEVTTTPDVARLTLGVQTGPQASAEAATKALTEKFNEVVRAVKEAGIKEEDIKTTNLSVNPVYDFTQGRQIIRGYEATESIEIKVRKLDTVGDVLSRATQEGVNQAGGIIFEVDDPTKLEEEAQTKAIADARARGERLANSLGARLGRVKTFTADVSKPGFPVPLFATEVGGRGAADSGGPPVPAGTNEIVATVNVTFELR